MDPVEEIYLINCRVTAIEREIDKLYHKRANLLHRLNFLQSSGISRFPSEILAQIFSHTLELLKPNHSLLSLNFPFPGYVSALFKFGAVCSHWRQTAWSSPQLWTFIPFSDKFSSRDFAALARTFCSKSGNLPISLYTHRWAPTLTEQVDETMHLIVAENSGRLKSIQFNNYSVYNRIVWPILCKYAQQDIKFSQLAEVVIGWDSEPIPQEGTIFRSSPLLRSLLLRASSGQCIMLDFPWSQLTKVNLYRISPNCTIKILYRCSNLIEFHNVMDGHKPSRARDIENPIPPQDNWTFIRPNMQVMTWDARNRNHEINAVLVTRFRFPNIRHLIWHTFYDAFEHDDAIRDFVTEMRQLETLKSFKGPRILRSILQQNIEPFHSLSSLFLNCIDDQDCPQFLHALTVQSGKETPLPNLRILDISGDDIPYDNAILLARSRRNGPVPPFDLGKEMDLEANDMALMAAYDPTSPHWHAHSRLEKLSLYSFNHGYEHSRLGHLLKEMVKEAKTSNCTASYIKLNWRE
jgi:hypothetical protein